VGVCLFCTAEGGWEPPARPAGETPEVPAVPLETAGVPPVPDDADRAFGLLLFEAEEHLARGQGEKAVVLSSKAVKDRPENVTARALYERARRELLRGRRREKLEARVGEAQSLFDRGSFPEAERIVTSALKFLPDHPVALQLLARLKERRAALGTVEAEAEGELELLAKAQARHALAAARKALAAGWDRRAMVAVRRGLRLVPGEPELLGLLRELQQSGENSDLEAARRRGLAAQIREATERLGEGRLEESLKILRAVLKEDPDNARAQAAIQQVRAAWIRRSAADGTPAGAARPAPAAAAPTEALRPRVPAASAPLPAPPQDLPFVAPTSRPRIAPLAPTPGRSPEGKKAIPPEILLPRARRKATPLSLVLLSAALVLGLLFYLTWRTSGPSRATPVPPATTPRPALSPTPSPEAAAIGPLSDLSPALRKEIEGTLELYARALESQDQDLLARARPDLSGPEREERLAPFVGALNVATDLRILEITTAADAVTVTVLRTDVIVGGRKGSHPPVEESLRFVQADGGWSLAGGPR
jgi:tetratricopeptide (TPR) repeat protein